MGETLKPAGELDPEAFLRATKRVTELVPVLSPTENYDPFEEDDDGYIERCNAVTTQFNETVDMIAHDLRQRRSAQSTSFGIDLLSKRKPLSAADETEVLNG